MSKPRFNFLDKVMTLAFLLFVGYAAIPSSIFLRVESMSIDQNNIVTLIRETPFGKVQVRWKGRVTVLHQNGFVCTGSGTATYLPAEADLVRYEIGDWASRCLSAGPPLSINYSRQVYLLGLFPLRPANYAFTITAEGQIQ